MFRVRNLTGRVSVAALCVGVAALAGCGGGRTISAGGGDTGDAPTSRFPIAFTVYTDANNNVTYREANGNLLTTTAAEDMLNSEVQQQGGATFAVFDPTTQTYNPNASTNFGRYLVTVTPTGTTTTPQYQFAFSDSAHPGTLFNNLAVNQSSLGPNFQATTQQFLTTGIGKVGFSTPSATGGANYITNFSNRFLAGEVVPL